MGKHIFALAALSAVALATPQQMDLDQILAAPEVPTGPQIVAGVQDETVPAYTSFPAPQPTEASAVIAARGIEKRANVISADATVSAFAGTLGSNGLFTSIKAGVSLWLNGGSSHNIYGNVENSGRLVISQTSWLKWWPFAGGQTCNWEGHDANNGNLNNKYGALIQLNDIGAYSAPTYSWKLRSLVNAGTLQWCGRGDTGGSTFQLYVDLDATNTGLISYEQINANLGASFTWRNPTLTSVKGAASANLYNQGCFRLINTVYHNVQNVLGNGCWNVGLGASLYLEDGTGVNQLTAGAGVSASASVFAGQSIFFAHASAVLHIDAAVYAKVGFGAQLYGFGAGNAIEFVETIQSFVYVAASGSLQVTFTSGKSISLNIGLGYDVKLFVKKSNPTSYNRGGYNAIGYNGPCPSQAQTPPAVCVPNAPVCSGIPGNGLPPYSSPPLYSTPVPKPTSSPAVYASSSPAVTPVRSSTPVVVVPSSTPVVTPTPSTPAVSSPYVPSSSSVASSSSSSTPVASTPSSSATPTPSSSPVVSPSVPATTPVSSSTSVYTRPKCPNTNHSPYYAALATGYTTDPALSATKTTTANQPCVTQPEAGTYCGFINPEDPCSAQPDGYGPIPDDAFDVDAWMNLPALHDLANNAPVAVPAADGSTYQQVFRDLNASVSANSYLGLTTLTSYDVGLCAKICDCKKMCTSFNIFAERDPSLNPSNNDSTAYTVWGYDCPNPAAQTNFKCTLWGSSIDADDATNKGEWREKFHVVITASNGYDKTNYTVPDTPVGPGPVSSPGVSSSAPASSSFSTIVVSSSSLTTPTLPSSTPVIASSAPAVSSPVSSPLKSSTPVAAPSSSAVVYASSSRSVPAASPTPSAGGYPPSYPWKQPTNCHGKAIDAPAYSLGGRFFPGPYNPQACSDYALAQNAANQRAGKSQSCKMFNAYYLHKNKKPHGTYCALYNSKLDVSLATNIGLKAGVDQYDVAQSWTFELNVDVSLNISI